MLIIDEGLPRLRSRSEIRLDAILVSMVDGELFEKLSKVGSIIRKHNDPFGGIQVGQLFLSERRMALTVL